MFPSASGTDTATVGTGRNPQAAALLHAGLYDHGAASPKPMGGPGRNNTPLATSERTQAERYAIQLGMPAEDVQHDHGPSAKTSWGQMFGMERLFIAPDAKPAQHARPSVPGQGTRLTPNQQVTMKGAIAHEVVGHREADLAGHSQTGSYEHYGSMPSEEARRRKTLDTARDEAQASLRAAKFAPDLSKRERKILFKDAMGRLAPHGMGVDDVPSLGLHLGQR